MIEQQIFLKKWTKPATGEVRVYINAMVPGTTTRASEWITIHNACIVKSPEGTLMVKNRNVNSALLGQQFSKLMALMRETSIDQFIHFVDNLDRCPSHPYKGVSVAQWLHTIHNRKDIPLPAVTADQPLVGRRRKNKRGKHNAPVSQNQVGTPVSQNRVRDSSFSFSGYQPLGGVDAGNRVYPKILAAPIVEALEADLHRALQFVATKYGLKVEVGKFTGTAGDMPTYGETVISLEVLGDRVGQDDILSEIIWGKAKEYRVPQDFIATTEQFDRFLEPYNMLIGTMFDLDKGLIWAVDVDVPNGRVYVRKTLEKGKTPYFDAEISIEQFERLMALVGQGQ